MLHMSGNYVSVLMCVPVLIENRKKLCSSNKLMFPEHMKFDLFSNSLNEAAPVPGSVYHFLFIVHICIQI